VAVLTFIRYASLGYIVKWHLLLTYSDIECVLLDSRWQFGVNGLV